MSLAQRMGRGPRLPSSQKTTLPASTSVGVQRLGVLDPKRLGSGEHDEGGKVGVRRRALRVGELDRHAFALERHADARGDARARLDPLTADPAPEAIDVPELMQTRGLLRPQNRGHIGTNLQARTARGATGHRPIVKPRNRGGMRRARNFAHARNLFGFCRYAANFAYGAPGGWYNRSVRFGAFEE